MKSTIEVALKVSFFEKGQIKSPLFLCMIKSGVFIFVVVAVALELRRCGGEAAKIAIFARIWI